MELIDQIGAEHQLLRNGCREDCPTCGNSSQQALDDFMAAIRALPAFAAVEPKEWPDAEGWWMRGEQLGRCEVQYHIDHYCYVVLIGGNGTPQREKDKVLIGHWLPVTLITPPVKEAEKAPERPKVLWMLAKIAGNLEMRWLTPVKTGKRLWRDDVDRCWYASDLFDPDESVSDPEAVKLWREETK